MASAKKTLALPPLTSLILTSGTLLLLQKREKRLGEEFIDDQKVTCLKVASTVNLWVSCYSSFHVVRWYMRVGGYEPQLPSGLGVISIST
jgi:hypothetical protein